MQVFKKALAFLLVNVLVAGVLQFALGPVSDYEQDIETFLEGEYDSLIIGSSYGSNLVPELLPEGDGLYNLSRPRVSLEDFYYIVREMDKKKDLKTVYLDVCPPYWTGELGDTNRIPMLRILSGLNELDYFYRVLTKQNYNDFFFKYELDYDTLATAPETIRKKLEILRNGHPAEKASQNNVINIDNALVEPDIFLPEQVIAQNIQVFRDLVSYCREQNIKLIGFATALPMGRVLADNLGEVHTYYSSLFSECGVPLYDFNYVKWEYLPRPNHLYRDMDGHMLQPLAEAQTRMLTVLMASEDPESYMEKDFEAVRETMRAMQNKAS